MLRRLLLLAPFLLLPRLALADPKDDARRHFLAGLQLAQQQQYDKALEEFLKAQDAWPHPNTLYNIARAYGDLGQLDKAIAYYQLYRDAAPDHAGDVDPVIAVLQAQLRQQQAPPSADLDRLAALRNEEAALTQQLQAAGVVIPEAGAPPPTPPPPAEVAPPEVPSGPFLLDAYQQEVVTASRYGQSPLDSPSTVTVLSEEDIRSSGATNVPDLLRRVAGVEVMSLSSGQVDMSIRGFNRELSNKVLVLIDGRSVYQDFMGTVVWATLPIALEDIERIEIIKGPASAIYGANAVTGVINILTRTPGKGRNELYASAGTPDYAAATASITGANRLLSWRFGGGYQRVERWSSVVPLEATTEGGPLVPFTEDQETSLRVIRANGRVDVPFATKGLASVSGGYAGGFTEFYTLGALGDYGFDFQSGDARLDIGYEPIHFRVFANILNGDAGPWLQYQGERSLRTHLSSSVTDGEIEYLKAFDTGIVKHHLNLGASYRYKNIAWDYLVGDGIPIEEHHFAAFLQEDARFGRFGLVGSLRMDRHPLVPLTETLSPRGALIFRAFPQTSIRLSGGTSFRTPSFVESYTDLVQSTPVNGIYVETYGDKNLLPERILSGEIGLRDESSRFHTADVAVFVNRVTRLIDLTDLTPNPKPFDPAEEGFSAGTTGFANLPDVWTGYGVEAELNLFPVDGLDLFGNLNWERVLDDDGSATVVDQATSQWKVNLGATYRSPIHLDITGQINYSSAQTWRLRAYDANGQLVVEEQGVPERMLVSAKVTAHPFKDDGIELSVSGWNLGGLSGERFREHPKGQLVGGRLYGTLGWRF